MIAYLLKNLCSGNISAFDLRYPSDQILLSFQAIISSWDLLKRQPSNGRRRWKHHTSLFLFSPESLDRKYIAYQAIAVKEGI